MCCKSEQQHQHTDTILKNPKMEFKSLDVVAVIS